EVLANRALELLGETLLREGAPVLMRAVGSGSIESVLVSIDAPWQKTSVRTEHFEQTEPFVFTRGLVAEKVASTSIKVPEQLRVDESVIGTILNGYETRNPYGKEANRASIVILTSFIDERVAEAVISMLRGFYHTKNVRPIAGNSLRFQAIRYAFPHERDALILDVTDSSTSIALVRRDLFVAIAEATSAEENDSWVKNVTSELTDIAKHYPLPRTIFLLARETKVESLQKQLGAADLGKLWLSDDPPKVVAVLPSHVSALVRQSPSSSPDLLLLLMTLFAQAREGQGE
ncbi:MAG: hypothetical protein WCV89_04030, partial [Candidatus Paceibacterota bacterium]